MSYEFYGSDELFVVHGQPDDLLDALEAGRVETRMIAGAVVIQPGVMFLYPAELLENLLEAVSAQRLSYVQVLGRLREQPAAERVARRSASSAGVVVEDGRLLGAWVDPPPVRGLGRREWRAIDEPIARSDVSAPGERGLETIRRTPHLDAPSEVLTTPGTEFTIEVYTDGRDFAHGESGDGVALEIPPDVDGVDLDVDILVTEHFRVDGRRSGTLRIVRDVDRSEPLTFTVTTADNAPSGAAGIQAIFSYRARPCGHVGRAWYWSVGQNTARIAASQPRSTVSLPIHTESRRADLTVVVAAPVNDGVNYQCKVTTDLIDGFVGDDWVPWAIPAGGHEFVSTLLSAIVDEKDSEAARRRALATAGYELWDAAPANFREALWALVDAGRKPANIYIASVEPTIPWELMIPTRHNGKLPDEMEPLGVEFAIGRWSRSDGSAPPPTTSPIKSCVIAPRYSGSRVLNTSGEVAYVVDRMNGALVAPATVDHIDDWFASNPASLLHFACHGAADVQDDDAIYLDREEVLRSKTLRALVGLKTMCKQHRPIVFVNACDTGRMTPSLAGGAGFPRAFGDIGARAVIAPLWPVDDKLAHEVAIELYDAGLATDAPPLAEILRRIRKRAYDELNADTYAAYSFYGDPLMTLNSSAQAVE